MSPRAKRVLGAAVLAGFAALSGIADTQKADRIVVAKAARKLYLYREDRLLRTYRIALETLANIKLTR